MRRRGIVAAGLLLMLLVAVILSSEREPRYKSKKLSEWLAVAVEPRADGDTLIFDVSPEAEEAIRAIGTNAVPFLVKWIRHERPLWKDKATRALSSLPTAANRPVMTSPIGRWLSDAAPDARGLGLIQAFAILGTNASSAAPELIRIIKNRQRSEAQIGPIYALGYTGTAEALSTLTEMVTNSPEPIRSAAEYAIGTMPDLGTRSQFTIALLSRFAGKGDVCAIMALGNLAGEPTITVPALTNAMASPDTFVRETAIQALGKLGSKAASAEQSLRNMLNDEDPSVRFAATNSLREVLAGLPEQGGTHHTQER